MVHQAVSVPAIVPRALMAVNQGVSRAETKMDARGGYSPTTYTLLIIPVSLLSGCLPHHSF